MVWRPDSLEKDVQHGIVDGAKGGPTRTWLTTLPSGCGLGLHYSIQCVREKG